MGSFERQDTGYGANISLPASHGTLLPSFPSHTHAHNDLQAMAGNPKSHPALGAESLLSRGFDLRRL
jgi:hypothetical protein